MSNSKHTTLSIVIPCYNEENTLQECVKRILEISDENLSLEIIIVDDHSTDNCYSIAKEIESRNEGMKVIRHSRNLGKGAAVRSGIQIATGDLVAIQDADLEYDPEDLRRLIVPLVEGRADVVIGSRFLSVGAHRVLYFWHSLGNRFLTFLSNMFTDLNLTDMETCYKIFKRKIIQGIDIKEDRFGFEPEIVAKLAKLRPRIYEMGISYYGRTYAEGKKIGVKDGVRALYCIFRYSAHVAPWPLQIFLYFFIGLIAAIVNFIIFIALFVSGVQINFAAPIAFIGASVINYLLCVAILFQQGIRWKIKTELWLYLFVVSCTATLDLAVLKISFGMGIDLFVSKIIATVSIFFLNFAGRRCLVFPESATGDWQPQKLTKQ